MGIVLTLRTDAEGCVTPEAAGRPLADPTPLAALPDLARLLQDPFQLGQARDAAIAVRRGEAEREPIVAQLRQLAPRVAADEDLGPGRTELAAFLHAVAALLEEAPVPPVPVAYAAHMAAIQEAGC